MSEVSRHTMWRSTVPIGGMPRMARLETPRSVRFMFQTILVGYDGPERGGEATALAEALRDPTTGTLLLTSVYPPAPPPVDGFVAPQEIEGRRDDTVEALRVARDSMPDKDRVMIRAIPSHSASRALTTVAEAEQADLVVVGSSRQRNAPGRLPPATTPERLLHDAPCPVAVAPRGYSGGDIRRIGVAHDGSHEADAALHAAESLALELPAALTVYCVVEPASPSSGMIAAGAGAERSTSAATERVRDLMHGVLDITPRFLEPGWVLVHGVPAAEIAGRAYGVVDLLFVGSRGYGPAGRTLLDNVSAVVREAGCPVVVVPRPPVAARHGADATVMAHA
jgi:nucleotide-binding universal stress UspA family protein